MCIDVYNCILDRYKNMNIVKLLFLNVDISLDSICLCHKLNVHSADLPSYFGHILSMSLSRFHINFF